MSSFLFKFLIKVGTVGGVVYYSKEIGVWDDSKKSYELAKEISAFIKPYINDVKKQVPAKASELPALSDICRGTKTYWNNGMIHTFTFVENIPHNINVYTNKGVTYVINQFSEDPVHSKQNE